MRISDQELTIRSAELADAPVLCAWWNDGDVMAHAGFPKGLNTSVARVEEQIGENTKRHQRLIIEFDSTPIGEMSYRFLDESTVQIGIKICESVHQEKGYGSRLLRMFIEYLFDELKADKIVLDTNLDNTRAQHVYEKIGFIKVRVRRDAFIDQLDRPQSAVDYVLFKKDYYD